MLVVVDDHDRRAVDAVAQLVTRHPRALLARIEDERMPSVRHSSAYCTIAPGSFGEMMARPQSSIVRNDSCAGVAIAPV
jgi:hypothetical protein